MAEVESIPQPYKYAGLVGIQHEGNELYYMRARYYDAGAKRFISEDPAGFIDGPNLYAYVGGNPIMLVDPSGLSAEGGAQKGGFLNSRSSCPGECGVYTNPNTRERMWVSKGVLGDLVSADAKGISLSAEQTTPNPSASDVVNGVGTAADATMLIFPASAPVTGPIGRGADLLQAIIDGSPLPLIPGAAGRGAQNAVLRRGGSVNSATRAGAATELVVDQVIP